MARLACRAAFFRQLPGERFNLVKDAIDLTFIAPQSHAFCQCVGDDQKTLIGHVFHADHAAGEDFVILIGRNHQLGRFVILRTRAPTMRSFSLERTSSSSSGDRPTMTGHTKTIERDTPMLAHMKGEWRRGNRVFALKARRINAVAEQQGARGDTRIGEGFRFSHDGLLQQDCDNSTRAR